MDINEITNLASNNSAKYKFYPQEEFSKEEKPKEEKPKEDKKENDEKKESSGSSSKEKHLVIHGATCECKFSESPQTDELQVRTQKKHFINDKDGSKNYIATNKDIGQTLKKNTFGKCKLQPTNSGYKPCQAVITQWSGFYDKVTYEVNGGNPLLEDSKATCPIGGPDCISIKNHGQKGEGNKQQAKAGDNVTQNQANPIFKDFKESEKIHAK